MVSGRMPPRQPPLFNRQAIRTLSILCRVEDTCLRLLYGLLLPARTNRLKPQVPKDLVLQCVRVYLSIRTHRKHDLPCRRSR